MSNTSTGLIQRIVSRGMLLAALAITAACTTPETVGHDGVGVFDPYEAENRRIHAFNKGLDSNVVKPLATTYDAVLIDSMEDSVSAFASNLSVPGSVINQVLQGDLPAATRQTVRFTLNSTLGIAGLFDIATDLGVPEEEADFGQTLAVWGLPQGTYLELPALGPASERDAAGKIVDFALNPLRGLEQPAAGIATGARIGARLGQRGRFGSTIDSVLYESVDSYATTRDIYLQNRAFELGEAATDVEDSEDPYADIFGE
ncbi:MlaA family lipoprotein [Primorskyibacter sp. S187A]|uniref:MlaA family lipoprotein n=1 Tax=Primorskyibacter sp. S187A TaxID=3415130 RepID=UPI003C7B43E6